MKNLILALFIYEPGTEVKIVNPSKYEGCPATIISYDEHKDTIYYSVQVQPPCANVRLHGILERDFNVPRYEEPN